MRTPRRDELPSAMRVLAQVAQRNEIQGDERFLKCQSFAEAVHALALAAPPPTTLQRLGRVLWVRSLRRHHLIDLALAYAGCGFVDGAVTCLEKLGADGEQARAVATLIFD